MHDRCRIGQATGFDEHAIEIDDLAGTPLDEQLAQRLLQIGPHRAAQAAVGQQSHRLGGIGQQRVVDADLAELVHDHRRPVHIRMAQQSGEQRALAATQKAGDDRDRDAAGERIAAAASLTHTVISST